MKLTGGLLLLALSAVSLAGCIHATGPCYGVGCHAFAPSSAASSKNASSQPVARNAGAASNARPHGFHALLAKIRL